MEGEWTYSLDHNQTCLVMETQKLWSETTCQCKERFKRLEQVIPEIVPILITKVAGDANE
jgi:hypothetical protein